MKKLTFQQFCDAMSQFNRDNNDCKTITGVIVFSQDSFTEEYSLESRSYRVSSQNKYFKDNMIGNSMFGSAIDGSDSYVRLDYYIDRWKVDYCYIEA